MLLGKIIFTSTFPVKDCENFKRLMAVNQSPSPHREFEADGTTIIIDYAQVIIFSSVATLQQGYVRLLSVTCVAAQTVEELLTFTQFCSYQYT